MAGKSWGPSQCCSISLPPYNHTTHDPHLLGVRAGQEKEQEGKTGWGGREHWNRKRGRLNENETWNELCNYTVELTNGEMGSQKRGYREYHLNVEGGTWRQRDWVAGTGRESWSKWLLEPRTTI